MDRESAAGDETMSGAAVLRLPGFRPFLVCQTAFTLATQVQAVAVGWQLYLATGSYLMLGWAGLAEVLPHLLCSPVAGHLVDSRDRRTVAAAASLVQLACAGLLVVLSRHGGAAAWAVLAAVAMTGVARALLMPARTALLGHIIPRRAMTAAVGWRSGIFQLGAIAGPALGGAVIALGGTTAAFAVELGLIVVSLATLSLLPACPAPPGHTTGFLPGYAEGLRFLRGQPALLGAMAMDLLAVLFGGCTAMLPAFAKDVFAAGPGALGWLRAAPAFGALAMSVVLLRRGVGHRPGVVLLWSAAGFGACMVGFALCGSLAAGMVLLAIGGACDQVSVVVRQTLMQLVVPPALMGRVSAVSAVFITSSNELGAFESGVAARLLGLVPSVVAGGAITIATVAGLAVWVPSLRRLEKLG